MTITAVPPSGVTVTPEPACIPLLWAGTDGRPAPPDGLLDRTVHGGLSGSPTVAFETRSKLRFYDMDRAGMVFHGAYTRLFQDAFEDLMEHVGYVEKELEGELGVRVPVVDHHMRFPSPPEGDELTIAVHVPEIGETSARFHLEARDDGRTVAEADITRVCIGEGGEPTRVPDELRAAWEKHRG